MQRKLREYGGYSVEKDEREVVVKVLRERMEEVVFLVKLTLTPDSCSKQETQDSAKTTVRGRVSE